MQPALERALGRRLLKAQGFGPSVTHSLLLSHSYVTAMAEHLQVVLMVEAGHPSVSPNQGLNVVNLQAQFLA